jgi:trehalose 6-phosphate phosphatase
LMTHEPFKGRRPFFIGDDVTDESVFAIMPDLDGLAFSVGRRAKGVAGHFDAPSDVREFLALLLDDDKEIAPT